MFSSRRDTVPGVIISSVEEMNECISMPLPLHPIAPRWWWTWTWYTYLLVWDQLVYPPLTVVFFVHGNTSNRGGLLTSLRVREVNWCPSLSSSDSIRALHFRHWAFDLVNPFLDWYEGTYLLEGVSRYIGMEHQLSVTYPLRFLNSYKILDKIFWSTIQISVKFSEKNRCLTPVLLTCSDVTNVADHKTIVIQCWYDMKMKSFFKDFPDKITFWFVILK